MDWTQVLTVLGSILIMFSTTVAMFKWARSEAREDRAQNTQILIAIQQQINAIHQEMKDFHGQLCTLRAEKK